MFRNGSKLEFEVETKSTFQAFDEIEIVLHHEKILTNLKTKVKVKYHHNFLDADIKQNNSIQDINYIGTLDIKTSMAFLTELFGSYKFSIDRSNNLDLDINIHYNDEKFCSISADGFASKSKIDATFEIEQNLKTYPKILGEIRFSNTMESTQVDTVVHLGEKSLLCSSLMEGEKVYGKAELKGPQPAVAWFKYSGEESERFFQSEIVSENFQLFATNFKVLHKGFTDLSITTDMKILHEKISFQLKNTNNEKYIYYDTAHGFQITSKIYLYHKKNFKGKENIINIEIDTPNEIFNSIKVISKTREAHGQYAARLNINYKDTYILHDINMDDRNASTFLTSFKTNILESITEIDVEKTFCQEVKELTFRSLSNGKKFQAEMKIKTDSPTRSSFTTFMNGTYGQTKLAGYLDMRELNQEGEIVLVDTDGKEFKGKGLLIRNASRSKIDLRMSSPFTKELQIIGDLDTKLKDAEIKLNFIAKQLDFVYASFTAEANAKSSLAKLKALLNLKNIIDLPEINFECNVNLFKDVIEVLKSKSFSKFAVDLRILSNQKDVLSLTVSFSASRNRLNGEFSFHSSIESFKKVKLSFEFDIAESDRYMRVILERNEEAITSFIKLSQMPTKIISVVNLTTPFLGYKIIDIDASYDRENNMLHLRAKRENEILEVKLSVAYIRKSIQMNAQVLSSSHSWKEINIIGTIDKTETSTKLRISGGSEDKSHELAIELLLQPSSGEANIKIELPSLGITGKMFKGSYFVEENKVEVQGLFNFEKIQIKYEKNNESYIFTAETPFSNVRKVNIHLKPIVRDEAYELSGKLDIESISWRMHFIGRKDYSKAELKLQTNSYIEELEVKYAYLDNEQSAAFKYNDMSIEARLRKNSMRNFDGFALVKIFDQLHHISSEFYQDRNSNTSLKIGLNFNGKLIYGDLRLHPSSIELQTRFPVIGELITDVSWLTGHYHFKIIHNSEIIFDISADQEYTDFWTGMCKLDVSTASSKFKHITFTFQFDLGKVPRKAMKIDFLFNDLMFDLDFVFNLTHDKFDGKLKFSSNIQDWENALITAAWNIQSEPEARISILRNGKLEEVSTKVKFKGVVPIVLIKTPFIGYEKIQIGGKYLKEKFLLLKMDINSATVLRFNMQFMRVSEFKKFDFDLENPSQRKNKYYSNAPYSVDAYISTIEKAYFITYVTPTQNIKLQGQFGTTELKSMFSIGKGRHKREVAFDFKTEQENLRAEIRSQTAGWRGIRIGAGYQSDAKAGNFNFESYGEFEQFEFSFKYDLTKLPVSGFFYGKIACPSAGLNYRGKIDFNFSDASFRNGFNAEFSLLRNSHPFIAGEIKREPGLTDIKLSTPFEGWRIINFILQSDWKTKVEFSLERDSSVSKFALGLIDQHGLSVKIVTPYAGYESIDAEIKLPEDDVSTVKIISNGVVITLITVDVQYDPTTNIGHVEVKWRNQNNVFITGKFNFDDNNSAGVVLRSSFAKLRLLKLEAEHIVDGDDVSSNFELKFNEHFFTYKSNQIWTLKSIKSISTTESNLWFIPFKISEGEAHITYDLSLESPFTLKFKSVDDGKITFDVLSSVNVNLNNGEIELIYIGDFPIHGGKVDAKVNVSSDLNTKLQIKGIFNQNEFDFSLVQIDGKAEAHLKSNIEHFEDLHGIAHWKLAEGTARIYGLQVQLKYKEKKFIQLNVEFDTAPFTNLKGGIVIPEYLDEHISLNLNKSINQNYDFALSYTGFNNIDLGAKLDMVNLVLEAFIYNKTENRNWNLKIHGDVKSQLPINVSFELQLITPFTSDFNSKVEFDFSNIKRKSIETLFKYGDIHASLEAFVIDTNENFVADLQAHCPSLGLNGFALNINRNILKQNHERIHCCITRNGTQVEGLLMSNFQPDFYDVSLEIKLPIPNYETIKFFGSGKTDISKAGNFGVILNASEVSLQYAWDSKYSLKIVLSSPLEIGKNIIMATDVKKDQHYNIDASWDAYEIRLHNTILSNGVKLSYMSNLTNQKELDASIFLEHGSYKVDAVITGFGDDVNVKAVIASSLEQMQIDLEFGDFKFAFLKNDTYSQGSYKQIIQIDANISKTIKYNLDYEILKELEKFEASIHLICPLTDLSEHNFKIRISASFKNDENSGFLLLSHNGNSYFVNSVHKFSGYTNERVEFSASIPGRNNVFMFQLLKDNEKVSIEIAVAEYKIKADIATFVTNVELDLSFVYDSLIFTWNSIWKKETEEFSMTANLNGKIVVVTVNFQNNYENINLTITSPFEDLETIRMNIQFRMQQRVKHLLIDLQAPKVKISINVNLQGGLYSSANVVINMESIAGKYTYTYNNNIKVNALFKNDLSTRRGSLKLSFSENEISINFGSTVGHIYMEIVTPLVHLSQLKIDINHRNGDLIVLLHSSVINIETKFIKTNSIYNFDIHTDLPGKIFSFSGKVDVLGKGLFTFLQWNNNKISMKANYSGNSVLISLKTPFNSFRNIILKGAWKYIENGFNVTASGGLNSKIFSFEAFFTSSPQRTAGFWKLLDENSAELVKFDLNIIKKVKEGMKINVQLEIPDQKVIKMLAGFSLTKTAFVGDFKISTPFQNFISDVEIYFKAEKVNSNNMSFALKTKVGDDEIELTTIYIFESDENVQLKVYLNMPSLLNREVIDFLFHHNISPNNSLSLLNIITPMSRKFQLSSNSTYMINRDLSNIQLNFPALRIQNLQLNYERIQNQNLSLELNMNYEGYQKQMQSKVSLAKTLSNNSEYDFNLIFAISTPFTDLFPDMSATMVSSLKPGLFGFSSSINAPDQVLDIKTSFEAKEEGVFNMTGRVNIPKFQTKLSSQFFTKASSINDFEATCSLIVNNLPYKIGVIYRNLSSKFDSIIFFENPENNTKYKLGAELKPVSGTENEINIYINSSVFQCKYDVHKVWFEMNGTVHIESLESNSMYLSYVDGFTIHIEYDNSKSANFVITGNKFGTAQFRFLTNIDEVAAFLKLDLPTIELKKSAEVFLKLGMSGSFEVSILDGENSFHLNIPKGSKVRKTRSVKSSDIGPISFNQESKYKEGVLEIATLSGIHHISYDFHDKDFVLHIESPYLDNGFVTLKLTLDSQAGLYRGSLGMNEDHLLSGFIMLTNTEVDLNINCETTYIPNKVSVKMNFLNDKTGDLSGSLEVQYEKRHYISSSLSWKDIKHIAIDVHSTYIPFKHVSLNTELKEHGNGYSGSIDVSLAEEVMKMDFSTIIDSSRNFSLHASLTISQLRIDDGKLSLVVNFDSSKEMLLSYKLGPEEYEVYSEFEFNHLDLAGKILISTPLYGFENIVCDLNVSLNQRKMSAKIILPTEEINCILTWYNQANNEFALFTKVSLPTGNSYFLKLNGIVSSQTISLSSFLPYFGKISFDLTTTSSVSDDDDYKDKRITINVNILNLVYKVRLALGYSIYGSMEIQGELQTPHPGFQKQSITLGYSNTSTRKMLKAFIDCSYGSSGFMIEYSFVSLKNIILVILVDFPHPDWSDFSLDLGFQYLNDMTNIRLNGSYEERKLKINFLKMSDRTDLELQINETSLTANYIKQNFTRLNKHCADLKIQLLSYVFENNLWLEFEKDVTSFHFKSLLDNEEILVLTKHTALDKIDLVVKKLFNIKEITMSLLNYKDEDLNQLAGISASMINSENDSFLFEFCVRQTASGGNIIFKFKNMGAELLEIRCLVLNTKHQNASMVEILTGSPSARFFLIKYTTHLGLENSQKFQQNLEIKSVYYNFLFHEGGFNQDKSSSREVHIIHGVPGLKMHGIGFQKSIAEDLNKSTKYKYGIIRPKGVINERETMTITLTCKDDINALILSLNPVIEVSRFLLKVKFFYSYF